MKASEILDFKDRKTKTVKVKEWGNTAITLQELGLADGLHAFSMVDEKGKATLSGEQVAEVVTLGVIDPDTGDPLFTADDIPSLAKKSMSALMFLYREIIALSGADAGKN